MDKIEELLFLSACGEVKYEIHNETFRKLIDPSKGGRLIVIRDPSILGHRRQAIAHNIRLHLMSEEIKLNPRIKTKAD